MHKGDKTVGETRGRERLKGRTVVLQSNLVTGEVSPPLFDSASCDRFPLFTFVSVLSFWRLKCGSSLRVLGVALGAEKTLMGLDRQRRSHDMNPIMDGWDGWEVWEARLYSIKSSRTVRFSKDGTDGLR